MSMEYNIALDYHNINDKIFTEHEFITSKRSASLSVTAK